LGPAWLPDLTQRRSRIERDGRAARLAARHRSPCLVVQAGQELTRTRVNSIRTKQAEPWGGQRPALSTPLAPWHRRSGWRRGQPTLGESGTRPVDLTSRPMKGWLLVDADGHAEYGLRRWNRGLAYASSLQPK
jgi:hypothetical protein